MFVLNYLEDFSWNCIPQKKSDNKYAISFAITEDYSFAAANMIMGLYKQSAKLMDKTDIVIYHNGISEKTVQLLNTLHDNILFKEISFPESWRLIIENPRNAKWGPIVITKFFCFFLVQNYEKVLLLDVDMLITEDISELFDFEEDMVWRNVVAWKPKDIFESVLKKPDDYISAGNGGMILFNGNIKEYAIGQDEILEAYERIKNMGDGGIDENVIAYLAYKYQISVRELDIKIWNTPVQRMTPETKLVHFLDCVHKTTKPWKNLASYLYFEEWAENYQRWIDMGGEGPVNFSREDYYQLLALDKLKKIAKQKKKIAKQEELIAEQEGLIAKQEELIAKYKKEVYQLKSSNSYKLTEPFRKIKKLLKKILKF